MTAAHHSRSRRTQGLETCNQNQPGKKLALKLPPPPTASFSSTSIEKLRASVLDVTEFPQGEFMSYFTDDSDGLDALFSAGFAFGCRYKANN